ncbi:MAG: hypothetical protein WCF43_13785 [Steroidobacteraceae bacterium]
MRLPTLFIVLTLTAGCASQPAAPAAPAAAAVAAAAKPAAPAAVDATGKASESDTVLDGFKAKTRNGETVYCKKIARIGSNFATETCMTAAEAEELARRTDWERQEFRRNQAVCGTGGCGGT